MKKVLLSLSVVFVLFGCTNDESNGNEGSENATQEESNNISENKSLEKKIKNIVKENGYNTKYIVDYDIKGNYIYVYSYGTNRGLTPMIIKNNTDGLEWVASWNSIQTSSLGEEGTPIVTIVQPDDPEVKGVKVFGKPAKLIQTTIELSEDISTEVRFWVYYSDNPEEALDDFDEDITYIKE